MNPISMKNALAQLVLQSDALSKLTLLLLLVMSIVCWTITFYKLFNLYNQKNQLLQVEQAVRTATDIQDLMTVTASYRNTVPGELVIKYLNSLKSILRQKSVNLLTDQELEYLQYISDQNLDQVVHENEKNLSILSVCAAVSPLLGLFGTVWGLIHSFVSISALKNADITTVAPGIAEALIVTLAGLMVAIPALVSFHSILTRIRDLEHGLQNLLSRVEFVIRQSSN